MDFFYALERNKCNSFIESFYFSHDKEKNDFINNEYNNTETTFSQRTIFPITVANS